jgi:hypothetical protein
VLFVVTIKLNDFALAVVFPLAIARGMCYTKNMGKKAAIPAPKYKDTLFRTLFKHDIPALRGLYEAIEGVKIDPETARR